MDTISHMMIFCRDQDEAKAFYVDKLGFECTADVPFGPDSRWVALRRPGQDFHLSLVRPGAGNHGPEIQRRQEELLALGGFVGGIIDTDDCRGDFERLSALGVEFTEEPEDRFYGIDAGFRDPSGIPWRLTQAHEVMRDPMQEPQVSKA